MTFRRHLASTAALAALLHMAAATPVLAQTAATVTAPSASQPQPTKLTSAQLRKAKAHAKKVQLAQAQVQRSPNAPVMLSDAAPPPPSSATASPPPVAAAGPVDAGVASAPQNSNAPAEQIVVTGSRLKRTNLEALTPVVTVTSADIAAKGLTQAADVINQLPQAGVSGVSSVNSNFSDDAAGLQIVNLRNLGSDRTLVLVDGRRTVGGLAPGQGSAGNSSGVDLSTIPAYLIDKIDVVTGGGSSTYGSEAVAGVVNIRLKSSYNGVMFNQQYGGTTVNGDSRTTTTDLLMGSDFADDRGHAIFAAEYQDQGAVFSKDRAFSAFDINNGGVYSPSSFTPYGSVLTNNGRYVTLGGNSIAPYNPDVYGFNREALRTIQVPTTQLDTYSKLSYDIEPDWSVFSSFKFARTTATSLLEPIAIGAGQGSTTIGFAAMPDASADQSLHPGSADRPGYRGRWRRRCRRLPPPLPRTRRSRQQRYALQLRVHRGHQRLDLRPVQLGGLLQLLRNEQHAGREQFRQRVEPAELVERGSWAGRRHPVF